MILLNLLNEIINYLEQCNSSNSKELSAMQCEAIKVRVTDFLELVSPLDNNSNFELYQTLFWQKEAISQRISDLLNEIAKKDSVKAIWRLISIGL